MTYKLAILGLLIVSPGFSYFLNLDAKTPSVCLVFLFDGGSAVEEIDVVCMDEFTNQNLETKILNIESGTEIDLEKNEYHLNRKYTIHSSMYPKVKMCFENPRKDKKPMRIKVITVAKDLYSNKKDFERSRKMLDVLKQETQLFTQYSKIKDEQVSKQMSSLDKSSWYLYLAIAAKIYIFFVLAIFQGGLFVRHVAESNRFDAV